jgi:hypothetical protein
VNSVQAGANITRLALAASASGVTTIVAAPVAATLVIRVIYVVLVANGAVNVKFQSHTAPTDISGLFYLAANGGFVLPGNEYGWFATKPGEALDINLSGAVAVGGALGYIIHTSGQ